MARKQRKISVDDILSLYSRARGYNMYFDERGESLKNLEAFLMLSVLFEAVLTSLAFVLLEGREDLRALVGKRGKRYGIDNAINDLYFLGAINTDEFGLLEQFKNGRNDLTHDLFSLNREEIEQKSHTLFEIYSDLFTSMVAQFEDAADKI